MKSNSANVEITSKSPQVEQEARANLRDAFLRAVSGLNGRKCNILTYEQSTLEAKFAAWKPDGSEILVRDLKTPALVGISSALLRTPDILAIQFENAEAD